jgi:hypothetical protein
VSYPNATLEECLNFSEKIQKIAGKGTASLAAVAADLGVSLKTKSFTYLISAARQYGLIVKTKEGLQLTDRARRILNPINPEELPGLRLEAFKSPPLYQQLIERYDGESLPPNESIENLMYNDLGISSFAKQKAAGVFIENVKYVNTVRNDGIFDVNGTSEKDIVTTEEESDKGVDESSFDQSNLFDMGNNDPTILEKQKKDNGITYHIVSIALVNGRVAKVSIPSNLSKEDAIRIGNILDSWAF